MESEQCSNRDNEITVDSFREQGGVNDSYVLIYECIVCKWQEYTVAKNTKDVSGAKVLEVLDKNFYSEQHINKRIAQLNQDTKEK